MDEDVREYFGDLFDEEEQKPKRAKRKPLPECTDTEGEVIKRLGPTAICRVLNDPVSVTSEAPWCDHPDYALVYCEEIGIYIMRWGEHLKTAEFHLCSLAGHVNTYVGPKGRDYVAEKFIRMLRKGKVYDPPNQGDGRGAEEPG